MDKKISLYDARSYFGKNELGLKITEDICTENMYRHAHTFYELIFVKSGYGYHLCKNGADFLIPGSMVVLSPGVAHAFSENCSLHTVTCNFTPEVLESLERPIQGLKSLKDHFIKPNRYTQINCTREEGERLCGYLYAMQAELREKRQGWESMARVVLSGALIELSRMFSANRQKTNSIVHYLPYIRQVLGYIHENYREAIGAEDIAEHLGLSADYLTRLFKKTTGVSPVEYLRNYRVGKAIGFLQQSDRAVGEISAAVGISDLSVFSRQFKKITGVSPSAARKSRLGKR